MKDKIKAMAEGMESQQMRYLAWELKQLADRADRKAHMRSWRELIDEAKGDDAITHCTLSEAGLNRRFVPCGYAGGYFTAWSEDWVYFPACDSCRTWVTRVPRNPCDIATKHNGGLP